MNKIKYLLAAALFGTAIGSTAQVTNTSQLLDGYTYGHLINPAKEYDRSGYLHFVPFFNLNVGLKGNLATKDIFMKNPNGSGLVTYLHPSISYDKAMKGFSNNNKLLMDTRFDVLGFGFHGMGGYNTFGLAIRSNAGANIPFELFDLTKRLENKDYEVDDLGATATAWAELALGHSHQINEAWRIGVTVKGLVGAGYARINMDDLNLDLENPNLWKAKAYASMEVGLANFSWGEPKIKEYHSKPGTYEELNFNDASLDKFALNGGGFAIDLGAEWDLGKQGYVPGMKVSAALLDLGFIKWKNVAMAYNRGEEFVFDGFHDIQVENGPGTSLDDQLDEFQDKISDLMSLQDGGKTSKARMLGATLNLGVEYALPTYKKLRFGFLSTTHIQSAFSWNEERISVAVSPVKWFEVATSAAVGTIGASWGWAINIHPKGFNLFLGMDHILGKLSKQGIPLRSNADLNIGLSFPIGKSRK